MLGEICVMCGKMNVCAVTLGFLGYFRVLMVFGSFVVCELCVFCRCFGGLCVRRVGPLQSPHTWFIPVPGDVAHGRYNIYNFCLGMSVSLTGRRHLTLYLNVVTFAKTTRW